MTDHYERLAALVSKVRNARFGELVGHLEEVIEQDLWRDFTTPAGTRFEFRSHEFDYFLATQELDATFVRHSYLQADLPEMARRRFRLADITGRGQKVTEDERRPAEAVASLYDTDPSGAGERIRRWRQDGAVVVTDRTGRVAADPGRREAVETGRETRIERPTAQVWRVRWSDDRSVAQAIVDKLADDPDLESAVLKIMRARYDRNRRSEARLA